MRATVMRDAELVFATVPDPQFVVAYQPAEFADTLRAIAEGELEVGPLITGRVDIEAVADAFAELRRPEAHAKILVQPGAR